MFLALRQVPFGLCAKHDKYCPSFWRCYNGAWWWRVYLGTLYTISRPLEVHISLCEIHDFPCTLPTVNWCGSIFTFVDTGKNSHVSARDRSAYLFDSVHISFLLCRIREVYLSFTAASAFNTSISVPPI